MPSVFPSSKEVKYTDERVVKASKKRQLPFGLHALLCTEVKPEISKGKKTKGDMVVVCTYQSLRDINDKTSGVLPTIRDRLSIPIDNCRIPGHKFNDEHAGMHVNALHALFSEEELPAYPRWDKDQDAHVYRGKKIKADQEDTMREEAGKKAFKMFEKILDNPEMLKGRLILGRIGESKPDKTGTKWVNILSKFNVDRWPLDKNGEKQELVSHDGTDSKTPTRARRVRGKGNGSSGRARPARTRRGRKS